MGSWDQSIPTRLFSAPLSKGDLTANLLQNLAASVREKILSQAAQRHSQ
jgi:hypothetical protein